MAWRPSSRRSLLVGGTAVLGAALIGFGGVLRALSPGEPARLTAPNEKDITMRTLIALPLLFAGPAFAEPHYMTVAFAEKPCGAALEYIETPAATPQGMANMAMAFGYLLGFQAAMGGDLSGEAETVLKRIAADCAANPDKTALELLKGY